MNKYLLLPLFFLLQIQLLAQTNRTKIIQATNTAALQDLSAQWASQATQAYQAALIKAKDKNWPIKTESPDGRVIQLIRLDERGHPVYHTTTNAVSAVSTATNKVHPGDLMGLQLTGDGIILGEWDAGRVRETHEQLVGRVNQIDGASNIHNHAVHVCGTMIGSGVGNAAAKGMAYEGVVNAHDWTNAEAEMAAQAATGLLFSNHSYGIITGWYFDGDWRWYGDPTINNDESHYFGWYSDGPRTWDLIAENAPYYLMVIAAGNDRNDTAPANGTDYWYGFEDPDVDPPHNTSTEPHPDDCNSGVGYDCISYRGNAKNILTVGAVYDVSNSYNGPSSVTTAPFSAWGPTDDGRIKPDICANGIALVSSIGGNDSQYAAFSGTSMAAPSATGSCALLQEHYEETHGSGSFMRSSTLKALIVHTADEAGNAEGPDYAFGWGLMNTARAAKTISLDTSSNEKHIIEHSLSNGSSFSIDVTASGRYPLVATIAWTDPAAPLEPIGHDVPTIKLINDLDLRISSGGTTFEPYILDPSNLTAPATRGDNIRDNVEKVYIVAPTAGTHTITINHKGSLSGGSQIFSLIISELDDLGLNEEVCFKATHILASGTYTASGPSSGAGASHNDATHADWFYYRPPFDGYINVSSCGSGVNTRLWIHEGGCLDSELIAAADDECGTEAEITMLEVKANQLYLIEWDDRWSSATFDFMLDYFHLGMSCEEAIPITHSGTYTVPGPAFGGNSSQNDSENANWFSYTAPLDGTISINSCSSGINTRLYIHQGSCASLTQIASSDDVCGVTGLASQITSLAVSKGGTYFIEWDDRWSPEGFDFTFQYSLDPMECPVDTLLYVDLKATGSGSGFNWTDAITDLSLALQKANACGAKAIWVAQGTYRTSNTSDRKASFVLPEGVNIYGGFKGIETLLNQRDPDNNVTVLSGDIGVANSAIDNAYHVLRVDASVAEGLLDGFIIESGFADGGPLKRNQGGGLFCQGGYHLKDITIQSCEADSRGRAICNSGAQANLIIEDCEFIRNRSSLTSDVQNECGASLEVKGNNFIKN